MIAKKAIIIGSGASLREGNWSIPSNKLRVWSAIENELTIGINWCYKYFNPTVTLYGDYEFYISEKDKLKELPLVFGMQDGYYGRVLKKPWLDIFHFENNVYLLPNRKEVNKIFYHGIKAWELGFYSRYLSGILGINLAVALGCTEIYLLGMDCCATDGRTHFYQDEFNAVHIKESGGKVCGVGDREDGRGYKTSVYNQNFNLQYEPFKKELERIKIINVSVNSGITVFPKISYDEFYKILLNKNEWKNQKVLRKEILKKYKENYHD